MDTATVNHPPRFEPIALADESTVVAEFIRRNEVWETHYQSEAQLEQDFIRRLQEQQYHYLPIHNEEELIVNLRKSLENLNHIHFSDNDWQRFFHQILARPNAGVLEKTLLIQEDAIQSFQLENEDSPRNIYLLDKQHIHNNHLQVINQYAVASDTQTGVRRNRYDVTILVNGLPLVHIELKRRGMDLREAFNQITRYQRESFWAGNGLFAYVQLFVISNGTQTKYYSNSVRGTPGSSKNSSASFDFTSYWTDAKNNVIHDLEDFAQTFFARHSLLNILTRYCVLSTENPRRLLVMRPYQIAAAEAILQRIKSATCNHQLGSREAGGYIWHTTGSGKTLTSFKTAQLVCRMTEIEKVLFVVDRKDLDNQTVAEYRKFGGDDAVSASVNTRMLQKQLEQPDTRIVVTTIQKLSRFVKANSKHSIYSAHIVIIFDECHRSQFGDMHKAITSKFRRYHLFGFTGTPIFLQNAKTTSQPLQRISQRRAIERTTDDLFGQQLHRYTIVNAIDDKNVLPFKIDYVRSVKAAQSIEAMEVPGIDGEGALLAKPRIEQIVRYILKHFADKTRRRGPGYYHAGNPRSGFNSLFATASIEAAKYYYQAFSQQQAHLPPGDRLKIALIYSFAPNEALPDGQLGDEDLMADGLDKSSRDFLEMAIRDYNHMFSRSYDTSAEKFSSYYQDVSAKLKNRELDMAIVVNMFLTGFDAKTLNTLWLDKPLKMHGLMQAFSRTNRILNSVKVYGNIVCFRNLEAQTKEALTLFGNSESTGTVILQPYAHYYNDYRTNLTSLLSRFPLENFPLSGNKAKKAFISDFGKILKLLNILASFDEFTGNELCGERDYAEYLGWYNDIYREFREYTEGTSPKTPIEDDLVFEIELVKQVEVNVDYILLLVEQYLSSKNREESDEIRAAITRNINASPTLYSKKDLIEQFVDEVSVSEKVDEAWLAFIAKKKMQEMERIINEEKLQAGATRDFMERAFRDGEIKSDGTAIAVILPKISRFAKDNNRSAVKQRIIERLHLFFARYFALGGHYNAA